METQSDTKKDGESSEMAAGDCGDCGHSIIYHAPFVGCIKCSCDEFH